MIKLPEYMGPLAFGVKMGLIVPGMDIVQTILTSSSIATGTDFWKMGISSVSPSRWSPVLRTTMSPRLMWPRRFAKSYTFRPEASLVLFSHCQP